MTLAPARWIRLLERWPLAAALLVGLALGSPAVAQSRSSAPVSWTGADVDGIVDQCARAARQGGPDALARMVLAATLDEWASAGHVRGVLSSLGEASGSLGDQARWLAMMRTAAPAGAPWLLKEEASFAAEADPRGLVRTFAILGPFEDTGAGLGRAQGPESPGHDYRTADYSWGAYQVRYVRSLSGSVAAAGLPLDLYVHPRKESCTYLEAAVRIPAERAGAVVLHLGSTGSYRLLWDGVELGSDEQVHARLVVDRASVRLGSAAGDHLLTVKVCSTAVADQGRVRVRFTDERYRPLPLQTSSAPADLQTIYERLGRQGSSSTASAKLERLVTPLDRALELSERSSAEQLLVAAILRTLGGADDLRSPRAPGLLDRLTGAASVPDDVLAVAGLIAPSASNRSGWLQQALERAREGGDLDTAVSAQRALVEARLAARMPDLARAMLAEPPLREADDAHARWLRARVLVALGGSGLQAAALDQLLSLTAETAGRTPAVAWRTIAGLSQRQRPELWLRAVQQLGATQPGNRGPSYVRAHRVLGAEAVERAADKVLAEQSRAHDLGAIGELLLDLGRYRTALEVFELAAELCPNRAAAFRGLARARHLASPAERARQGGLQALERAQQLEPHRAELKAEIAFRQADEAGAASSAPSDDLQYLVEPEVFLARARAEPAAVGAQFERELHYRRVVRLHPDKRVSQLMHYAREIVVEPRTEDERYEGFPPSTGPVELLIARLHRKDGTVLAPEEQDDSSHRPMVRWPKLERGDVVELAVRTWTAGPIGRRGDIPFYFVDYSGSVDSRPVLYNEVVIDTPLVGGLAFDVINGQPDRKLVTERGGRRTTRLIWDSPVIVADEPFSPPMSELVFTRMGHK